VADAADVSVMPDEELLRSIRDGSAAAYAELYRRYEPEARRYARSVANAGDVDDVVAESFAKMLRALQHGKGPIDFPVRYLMVTVRRTASGLHAKRTRNNEIRQRLGAPLPVEDELPLFGDDHLVTAFGALSSRQRQALWWSEVEGLGAQEIGERLGINAAAAAALTYRARRSLRAAYEGLDRVACA
jgi:RNA polymerase sigma factor (sigma-70 family)